MNKGLEIRNKKLQKQENKRRKVKPTQKKLCRFVKLEWQVIEKVNGKYRRIGQDHGMGLQVENRVYLLDGHYKMVNSKSVKITKVYEGVPAWASEALIKKYDENQKKRRKRCNTCVHFDYGVNPETNKGSYYCNATMQYAESYLQLKECQAPQYKRK